MKRSRQQILKNTDLFSALTADEIDRLAELVEPAHLRDGEVLFLKGDSERKLYVVAKGVVRIGISSPDGREAILNHIKEGQVFGEIAAIGAGTRTADAIALGDVELLSLDHEPLIAFLLGHPDAGLRIMITLCDRVRWVSDLLEDHRFLDAQSRLAKRLLVLGRVFGELVDGGTRITMKLSQKDLASHVGITRERINRFLKRWQAEGIIGQDSGYLTLHDQEKLSAIAHSP